MVLPDDTIAQIATASGGGVGVLRVSGPASTGIAERCFRGLPRPWEARRLYHGWWTDGVGEDLDEGLVVVMPGPASYTGEDVVEIHLHGGPLNLRRCLEVCWRWGARPAEPGEFTRRAFLNGRMDLTRAEAIADLVAAQTDRALDQARAHLKGALYDEVIGAREQILNLRARLEVNIDFIDEDVPPMATADLCRDARETAASLRRLAETWEAGRLWREGARVVLVGPPNTGKSSLFNALCGDNRVIVTPVPGTTRDTVAETIDVLGVPLVLVDTAGIRATDDVVEREGIERARNEVASADLVLSLVDPETGAEDDVDTGRVLRVRSQVDRFPNAPEGAADLTVSAHTGEGLDGLREAMIHSLGGAAAAHGGLVIGRMRHRLALERAAASLETAASLLQAQEPPELVAVDVQDATDALSELVGLTTIEDVLDRLFSAFCIGK